MLLSRSMWFFLSLYFAFWSSMGYLISKRILRNTDVLVYLGFGNIIVASGMAIVLFVRGIPQVYSGFWYLVVFAAFINIFTSLAAFQAIKTTPISLLSPLSSFTALSTVFFGFIFLGETMGGLKLLGVLLIVIGAYLLHAVDIRDGILTPFAKLFQNRGVQLMLFANFLWGLTPVFEKQAIRSTNPQDPLFTSFVELVLLVIVFFPLMFLRVKEPILQFKKNIWWYILPAPFGILSAWAAFTAFLLTNVGYAAAIFKLSVLFTILWGALFFKEERIKERLLGGGIMLLGTVLLVI